MGLDIEIALKISWHESYNCLLYRFTSEQLLLNTVVFFSLLIIFLIVFILFYFFRKKRRNQRKISLQKKFNDFISEIAVCDSKEELNEVFLQPAYQKILNQSQQTRFERNLLIRELAETCKKFSGTTMSNINWLFQKIQLEKELVLNLNNHRWYIKAKAVQQLAYLQQQSQINSIFQLTNHENNLLRMEAQSAIVKLTGFDGLQFLNIVNHPISEWQQLRLIQELSGHTSEKLGNISQWLKSKNNSVVDFALRLVEIYRQYEYYDEVKECLCHPSASVCKKAVVTLSQISNETTAGFLADHYPNYDESIQLVIFRILRAAGTENEIPFLLSILNHPDDAFKMEAAKAIGQISAKGIEKIEELVDETTYPWNIILPQIKTEGIT